MIPLRRPRLCRRRRRRLADRRQFPRLFAPRPRSGPRPGMGRLPRRSGGLHHRQRHHGRDLLRVCRAGQAMSDLIDLAGRVVAHYNQWITVFLMVSGLYIVIARGNMVKKLVGLSLFQTSVYLLYISAGKILGGTAPIIDPALHGLLQSAAARPHPHRHRRRHRHAWRSAWRWSCGSTRPTARSRKTRSSSGMTTVDRRAIARLAGRGAADRGAARRAGPPADGWRGWSPSSSASPCR